MSPVRLAAVGAAVGAVALVVVLAASPNSSDVQVQTPLIGKPAPPVVGPSLTGGLPVSLAGLRGRYVLVNFFASWCEPCQAEASQLDGFAASDPGQVTVLGVVFQDNPADAARFVVSEGGHYPVVADPGGLDALHWGVRSPPTSFLVGPDGETLTKIEGQVTASGLEQLVALAQAKRT